MVENGIDFVGITCGGLLVGAAVGFAARTMISATVNCVRTGVSRYDL